MNPPTYVTQAITAITEAVASIGSVLFAGLTSVLGLVAALIGLFFLVRLVRRYISRGK